MSPLHPAPDLSSTPPLFKRRRASLVARRRSSSGSPHPSLPPPTLHLHPSAQHQWTFIEHLPPSTSHISPLALSPSWTPSPPRSPRRFVGALRASRSHPILSAFRLSPTTRSNSKGAQPMSPRGSTTRPLSPAGQPTPNGLPTSTSNSSISPIHSQYSSAPSQQGSRIGAPMPLQSPSSIYQYQQQQGQQQRPQHPSGSNYVPKRTAPQPPQGGGGGYDYEPRRDANGHIVDYSDGSGGGSKRDSYGGGPARSAYAPSSRPPYTASQSNGGGSSSSFQPSRAPPQPPRATPPMLNASASGYGGHSPHNPATPTRRPSLGGPSGLGGGWDLVEDAPGGPPKRPAPPPITSSLRDLSDALPPSTRYGPGSGLGSSSANSSNSSLIVHPPTNASQGPPQHSGQGHHPSHSVAQSYSLLTDPATSAAAGLAADVPAPSPSWGGATPSGGGRPGSSLGLSQGSQSQRRSWEATRDAPPVDSPSGSARGSGEGKPSKIGKEGGKSKGGLGSFLGEFLASRVRGRCSQQAEPTLTRRFSRLSRRLLQPE